MRLMRHASLGILISSPSHGEEDKLKKVVSRPGYCFLETGWMAELRRLWGNPHDYPFPGSSPRKDDFGFYNTSWGPVGNNG